MFKTQEESLELVLPRKGPIHTSSQGMDRCIEHTRSSSLHVLSIARILFDTGDHARIEYARAIVRGIKSSVEIQLGSSKVQTGRFGYPLSGLQTLGQQAHVRLMDGSHREGRQHIAMSVSHGDVLSPPSGACRPSRQSHRPLFWPRCWSHRHGARGGRVSSLLRHGLHWP